MHENERLMRRPMSMANRQLAARIRQEADARPRAAARGRLPQRGPLEAVRVDQPQEDEVREQEEAMVALMRTRDRQFRDNPRVWQATRIKNELDSMETDYVDEDGIKVFVQTRNERSKVVSAGKNCTPHREPAIGAQRSFRRDRDLFVLDGSLRCYYCPLNFPDLANTERTLDEAETHLMNIHLFYHDSISSRHANNPGGGRGAAGGGDVRGGRGAGNADRALPRPSPCLMTNGNRLRS